MNESICGKNQSIITEKFKPTPTDAASVRCEGWSRTGGAFTLGPVKWEQCKSDAIVNLKFKQGNEPVKTLPACKACWEECFKNGIEIITSTPI